MRLEMGHIYIRDIQFADESRIQDGVLYVSKEELEKTALEDEKIKAVSFDIARPGESVRITPVKDVIEPRVKVEGTGGVKDIRSQRHGCSDSGTHRRIPGGYHRYDRTGSTVHTLLPDTQSGDGVRAG